MAASWLQPAISRSDGNCECHDGNVEPDPQGESGYRIGRWRGRFKTSRVARRHLTFVYVCMYIYIYIHTSTYYVYVYLFLYIILYIYIELYIMST